MAYFKPSEKRTLSNELVELRSYAEQLREHRRGGLTPHPYIQQSRIPMALLRRYGQKTHTRHVEVTKRGARRTARHLNRQEERRLMRAIGDLPVRVGSVLFSVAVELGSVTL